VRKEENADAYNKWMALHGEKKYYSFKGKKEMQVPRTMKKVGGEQWVELPLDSEGCLMEEDDIEEEGDENLVEN